MILYTIMAYRWGIKEGDHTYLVGTFATKAHAEKIAGDLRDYRAGKYDFVVYEYLLNEYKEQGRAICTYRGLGYHDRVDGEVLS